MARPHVPLRTCVACKTKRSQAELVRLVRAEGGAVLIEPGRGVPGRGVYLCRKRQCWVDGVEQGRIARAFRGPLLAGDAAALTGWARASLAGEDS